MITAIIEIRSLIMPPNIRFYLIEITCNTDGIINAKEPVSCHTFTNWSMLRNPRSSSLKYSEIIFIVYVLPYKCRYLSKLTAHLHTHTSNYFSLSLSLLYLVAAAQKLPNTPLVKKSLQVSYELLQSMAASRKAVWESNPWVRIGI